MTFVTYKNRQSDNYRFSTTDLNDSAIEELRTQLKQLNKDINRRNKRILELGLIKHKLSPTYGIRIRARGPRNGDHYDTPMENATHYDIYRREYHHF